MPTAAKPADPLFDQPYEPSNPEAEAAWDKKVAAPAPRGGLSAYIKPKKKVAALFGAKPPATSDN